MVAFGRKLLACAHAVLRTLVPENVALPLAKFRGSRSRFQAGQVCVARTMGRLNTLFAILTQFVTYAARWRKAAAPRKSAAPGEVARVVSRFVSWGRMGMRRRGLEAVPETEYV